MKKTDISTKLKNLRIEEIKGCKIYSIEQLEAVKRSNFEMLWKPFWMFCVCYKGEIFKFHLIQKIQPWRIIIFNEKKIRNIFYDLKKQINLYKLEEKKEIYKEIILFEDISQLSEFEWWIEGNNLEDILDENKKFNWINTNRILFSWELQKRMAEYFIKTHGDNPVHLLGREQFYRKNKLPNEINWIIEFFLWNDHLNKRTFYETHPDKFFYEINIQVKLNLYKKKTGMINFLSKSHQTKKISELTSLIEKNDLISSFLENIINILNSNEIWELFFQRECSNNFLGESKPRCFYDFKNVLGNWIYLNEKKMLSDQKLEITSICDLLIILGKVWTKEIKEKFGYSFQQKEYFCLPRAIKEKIKEYFRIKTEKIKKLLFLIAERQEKQEKFIMSFKFGNKEFEQKNLKKKLFYDLIVNFKELNKREKMLSTILNNPYRLFSTTLNNPYRYSITIKGWLDLSNYYSDIMDKMTDTEYLSFIIWKEVANESVTTQQKLIEITGKIVNFTFLLFRGSMRLSSFFLIFFKSIHSFLKAKTRKKKKQLTISSNFVFFIFFIVFFYSALIYWYFFME